MYYLYYLKEFMYLALSLSGSYAYMDSQLQNRIEMYVDSFLKSKCYLLVYRSTLQNKIYYCVLLTMLHVIGHY